MLTDAVHVRGDEVAEDGGCLSVTIEREGAAGFRVSVGRHHAAIDPAESTLSDRVSVSFTASSDADHFFRGWPYHALVMEALASPSWAASSPA